MNFKTLLIGKSPRKTLIRAGVAAAVLLFIGYFVLIPMRTMHLEGQVMKFHLVNTLAYLFSEPRRGDTIAIRMAGRSVMIPAQITGLPGEVVQTTQGSVTLQEKEYLVEGEDSLFGRVMRERIVGRLLF